MCKKIATPCEHRRIGWLRTLLFLKKREILLLSKALDRQRCIAITTTTHGRKWLRSPVWHV